MNAPDNPAPQDKPEFDVYAGDADEVAAGDSGNTSESTIARLTAELGEAKDQVLRAMAEAENVRKRYRREAEDQRRYAEQDLIADLLPVLDNLRRAAEASAGSADAEKLAEGVKLVIQQFEGVLAKHHCVKIDAAGQPFDPNFHEALTQQPSADLPPGSVVSVFRDGYRLHDRVVRAAQVVVSKAPE